jgi:hypothetical protein
VIVKLFMPGEDAVLVDRRTHALLDLHQPERVIVDGNERTASPIR